MEEHAKEVTSHAGFGQDFPSNVPGVPQVGRTTGTPQGQLLPGLWPERPSWAILKAISRQSCFLWEPAKSPASPGAAVPSCPAPRLAPGRGYAGQDTVAPCPLTAPTPSPMPTDESWAPFLLLNPLFFVFFRGPILLKKCFCPMTHNKAKIEGHQFLVYFLEIV